MPGKGHRFTEKEDRQAGHVAESMRKKGMSPKKAKSVGFATVVKQGGGKKKRGMSDKAMLMGAKVS